MNKIYILPFVVFLAACGDANPTAIELNDLGKVGSVCFIERTPNLKNALNPQAGFENLGSIMEEMVKPPIKQGWKITSENRTTATLNTKRDGISYICEYEKIEGEWKLVRSLWDGEEAYSQEAAKEVKKQAQLKQDIVWQENGWMGESYKYYTLPPQGADANSGKELAINCKPNKRGVMLNGFVDDWNGQNVEFSFDENIISFGVSGGSSSSYLGDLVDSRYGKEIRNEVEAANKFIEALKGSRILKVMGETFVIDANELQKVPCISE